MRDLFCFLVGLVVLMTHATAALAAPGPTVPAGWRPVMLRVVDEADKPVETFGYRVRVQYLAGRAFQSADEAEKAGTHTNGEAVVYAPDSALFHLRIEGGGIISRFTERTLRSDDRSRVLTVKVRRGETLDGTVADAETGLPVAGALVMPRVFFPPGFGGDEANGSVTDAEGRFRVRGVDPEWGACAVHPDYGRDPDPAPARASANIRLYRKKEISGRIVSPEGEPVAGVGIDAGGSDASTGSLADGTFRIAVISTRESVSLRLSKVRWAGGYRRVSLADYGEHTFVMRRLPELTVQVMDEAGAPVRDVSVNAGIVTADGSAAASASAQYVWHDDACGTKFLLPEQVAEELKPESKCRLSIAAPGYAASFTDLDSENLERPFSVILRRETVFFGKVEAASVLRGGTVTLRTPDLREWPGETKGRSASIAPDGTFCIGAPVTGKHVLVARIPGFTPCVLDVDTTSAATPIRIRPVLSARVKGVLKSSSAADAPPESFVQGTAYWIPPGAPASDDRPSTEHSFPFGTDENGAFDLVDIPAGDLRLVFDRQHSGCLIESDAFPLRAAPGETKNEVLVRPVRK